MLRIAPGIVLIALAAISSACLAQSSASSARQTIQLPRTVRPVHYDIALEPDVKALTFAGDVTIAIDVLQPTRTIALNALDLRFAAVRLTDSMGRNARPAPRIDASTAEQTVAFNFDESLAPGSYRLTMQYTGKIDTQAAGLFAIDYDSSDGPKRALYTQFAVADARRVIPSWDEPELKATFSLRATVPAGLMAVSNMPIAREVNLGDGRSRVEFQRSPNMSTYLLFFAMGDFERLTTRVGDTELGVVTRRGAKEQAAFALESSAQAVREFNEYFAIPYPLPKLDNIAVPGSSRTFAAMENWGAILSFEYVLLLDPSISTQADKQNTFVVAAHEISHQWFGNLVTMRWWDDTWLNEGFASWMESRTSERLHPEWDSALDGVNSRETAIDSDALATSHPVVVHVPNANAANQMFDAITYMKGEAVIAMLESYVGEDAWRDGVRRYLKAHAYGSTVSDDLWREIEAVAREPVKAMAHDFTLQQGVPLIRVDAVDCKRGRTTARLIQTEFSRDQPNKKPLAWRVPVIVKTQGTGGTARTVVAGGAATIDVAGCGPLIVNAGQSGYYRTLYSSQQFASIAEQFAAIEPIDQLGILADTWALGVSGYQPPQDFFALTRAVPVDAHPQIWRKIADVFSRVDDYYPGDLASRARFREFAIGVLRPSFARVGWSAQKNEIELVALLRNQLIETLSALGDPEVITEARRRYAARASDPQLVSADMKKTVFGVVARHADAKTWESFHELARAEKTPLVKEQLYSLLAAVEDETLARRALDLALTTEPPATIRLDMVADTARLHPDLAFDFAVAHFDTVSQLLDSFARGSFIPYLGRGSTDAAMVDKINKFAVAHVPADSRRMADSSAATVADRVRVRRERLPAIDAWIATNR